MQPGFLLSAQSKEEKEKERRKKERQERNKSMYYHPASLLMSCHPRSREYRRRVQLLEPSHCAVLSTNLPPLAGLLVDKSTLAERIRAARGIGLQGLQRLLLLLWRWILRRCLPLVVRTPLVLCRRCRRCCPSRWFSWGCLCVGLCLSPLSIQGNGLILPFLAVHWQGPPSIYSG